MIKNGKTSDFNPYSAVINCTTMNILVNLDQQKMSLKDTPGLLHSIEYLMKITPVSKYVEIFHQLIKAVTPLEQEIETYQLINTLAQLTTLEYDQKYENTTYYNFIECIFKSMENNRESKDYISSIMTDVKNYLSKLSSKEIGELIVEHFTINYDRNASIYLRGFSSTANVKLNSVQSLAFVKFFETLEEEYLSYSKEEKLEKLSKIYQTDFYKKHFLLTAVQK